MDESSALDIVQCWLDESADTATTHDLAAHMDLISRGVKVYGVPGFDEVGYDDWYRQCEQEFARGLVRAVAYEGLAVVEAMAGQITFLVLEKVRTGEGQTHQHPLVNVLERESDQVWRLTRQQVLQPDGTSDEGSASPGLGSLIKGLIRERR